MKIRLPIEYAFALMGRLYPAVGAFAILKTTEALESIPDALAFVVGILCFLSKLNPWMTAMYAFCAVVAGFIITTAGVFVIPGLPMIGKIHSYLSGYGVLLISLVAIGLFTSGYKTVLAYFGGRLLGSACKMLMGLWNARRIYRKTGVCLASSEVNFLNAYRLHASRLGKTTDVDLSAEEQTNGSWKVCFEDLALKWPEVVRRFRIN